jgi:predicted signal transduction protein with EAL and GGDEF domain
MPVTLARRAPDNAEFVGIKTYLRDVFEEADRTCVAAELVRGEAFAIDTSVIEADASRVAVARKLITILNAILRDRRPWQPIPA